MFSELRLIPRHFVLLHFHGKSSWDGGETISEVRERDKKYTEVFLKKWGSEITKIFILRKILSPMGTTEAMEFLLDKMKDTKTNSEFFQSMGTK